MKNLASRLLHRDSSTLTEDEREDVKLFTLCEPVSPEVREWRYRSASTHPINPKMQAHAKALYKLNERDFQRYEKKRDEKTNDVKTQSRYPVRQRLPPKRHPCDALATVPASDDEDEEMTDAQALLMVAAIDQKCAEMSDVKHATHSPVADSSNDAKMTDADLPVTPAATLPRQITLNQSINAALHAAALVALETSPEEAQNDPSDTDTDGYFF
jgi:hypothetical protein